jgi:hypothetical protein
MEDLRVRWRGDAADFATTLAFFFASMAAEVTGLAWSSAGALAATDAEGGVACFGL